MMFEEFFLFIRHMSQKLTRLGEERTIPLIGRVKRFTIEENPFKIELALLE